MQKEGKQLLVKVTEKVENVIDKTMIKMKELMDYILKIILRIIGIILVSIFFVFLLFPVLINLKFVNDFLSKTAIEAFIAITALVLFFIGCTWARAKNLWQRYKNTYKLEKPLFIYPDYILLFIIFSALLITLFQTKSIPNPSSEFKVFAYLNLILIGGWLLSSYFWKKKKKEQKEVLNIDIYSLSDEPIKFVEQDLLGREKFIGDLQQEIIELPFTDSFVFGLYGSWGEGKTSVINLLRDKFEDNEDFLIVNFDPWHFKDEEAILAAFYRQVEETLSQKFVFPDLKNTFTRYQKLISFGLSQAGIRIDLSHPEESLEGIRQRIESCITKTDKKIIILIDDIDRLQPEEILLIFKLVRLNAKFQKTIFLLSFDLSNVKGVLAQRKIIRGNISEKKTDLMHENIQNTSTEFIEKIIQKPIVLPKIEQFYLDRFLLFSDHLIPEYRISDLHSLLNDSTRITTFGIVKNVAATSLRIEDDKKSIEIEIDQIKQDIFKRLNIKNGEKIFVEGIYKDKKILIGEIGEIVRFRLSWIDIMHFELLKNKKINRQDVEEFDKEFVYLYRSQISKLIKTLRQAKRYINSFYSSLPSIVGEVDIKDFALLEFIKVFQIELYNDIFENWWFYVDQRTKDDITMNPLTFLPSNEADRKSKIIKGHVEEILIKYIDDPIKKDVLLAILKNLFPNVEGAFR